MRILVIVRLDRTIQNYMEKSFYVYILSSKRNGTLYIGITSDLIKRVWEHKNKLVEGFTEKYGIDQVASRKPRPLGGVKGSYRKK